MKTRTKFGYLHGHYGPDMDGSSRTFEWIEDGPPPADPEYDAAMGEPKPGWFAMYQVERDCGWCGPFETEAEAIEVATNDGAFWRWMTPPAQMDDDSMGDLHGRNV